MKGIIWNEDDMGMTYELGHRKWIRLSSHEMPEILIPIGQNAAGFGLPATWGLGWETLKNVDSKRDQLY